MLTVACRKDLIRPARITRISTGTTARLNAVRFINDTLGFCAGGTRFDRGDILVTHDGGHTWRLILLPDATKELFGITVSPAGRVYLIGFDGKLLSTPDGGQTWAFRQLRYDAYKAIAFEDERHAQCVGGISFYRGDASRIDTGGALLRYDSLGFELADIYINAATGAGIRCGFGVAQYTVDGGKTWQWSELNSDYFNAIFTRTGTRAWMCGAEGSIAATSDGGKTWETLRNGDDITHPKYRLQDIVSTDDFVHGYAVGESGKVIYTDDGGRHWSELEAFTKTNLHGIAQCLDGDVMVCGEGGELWRISR